MSVVRYVALGDSQTEGLGDGDEASGLRGWADRLAELLDAAEPGLRYANLAVRGQLAGQVRATQLDAALALRPDLATVVAGMNDLLRPRFDADAVGAELEAMFAALTGAGARVATLTFPAMERLVPLARPLAPRVPALNARIREAAARHGVLVVETYGEEVVVDPRLWSPDRLHAAPSATPASPPPSPTHSPSRAATEAGPYRCPPCPRYAAYAPWPPRRAGCRGSSGRGWAAGCGGARRRTGGWRSGPAWRPWAPPGAPATKGASRPGGRPEPALQARAAFEADRWRARSSRSRANDGANDRANDSPAGD